MTCQYCSCDTLGGFNKDILNVYNGDCGVSIEIVNEMLHAEFDMGVRTLNREVNISYCPMCGKSLSQEV